MSHSPSGPGLLLRPLVILLVLQLCWLAGTRLVVRVGWGLEPRELPQGMLAPGWMTNLTDNLGYSAFLQQVRWGETGTAILYTTTPHPAGYFNALFWILGRLAGLTNTRPEAWLLITGVLAALACTAGIYSLGHLMGGRAVALASGCVCVFGSGWTWIQRIAAKLMGWDHYNAADLRFMDLLPSSAGIFYPLHTVGLALMTWISWLLLSGEPLQTPRERRRREVIFIALGFLLGWIRPYEPAVLLGIYGLYTALGLVAGDPLARLRLRWLVLLGGAVLPGLAYSGWLAFQPVWNILSGVSLTLVQERAFWLQGFGGLWLAGGLGAWLWRRQPGPARFAVIWYGTAAILLLVVSTAHTKLLSGAGLALALVSGPALVGIWNGCRRRLPGPLAAPLAAVLILVLVGPGSLVFAVRESCLDTPRIDASVWHAANRVRQDFPRGTPTVLTEYAAAEVLPGIIGARIWAGHWILTDDGKAKHARLRAAGLEPDSPRDQPRENLAELRHLLQESRANYLLIHDGRPAQAVLAEVSGLRFMAQTGAWSLFAWHQPENR